jgi:hypothetical protein
MTNSKALKYVMESCFGVGFSLVTLWKRNNHSRKCLLILVSAELEREVAEYHHLIVKYLF